MGKEKNFFLLKYASHTILYQSTIKLSVTFWLVHWILISLSVIYNQAKKSFFRNFLSHIPEGEIAEYLDIYLCWFEEQGKLT